MRYWWRCDLCMDTMRVSSDPRDVERDRDAHLRDHHADQPLRAPRDYAISSWPTAAGDT